ncbi:hypothetical protein GH714_041635 [Hevea brasiliensis]|uniref:Haloacid dehalogenase-like hydrolase domain-containing protein Sgpp n=1 Tax=Hevea brasiliensis TaxID=3981 RepID=A0A6A6MSV7_HEVBR|nr:hypothetical protein GH714_041635 [Hevea brasiliensis]
MVLSFATSVKVATDRVPIGNERFLSREERWIAWKAPQEGWCKLNTDGAFKKEGVQSLELRYGLFHRFEVSMGDGAVENCCGMKRKLFGSCTTNRKMTVSSADNSVDTRSDLSRLAPLEAVLFDVDGTLCDSDPLHHYAFREMLQEINFNGGVPITEEFFIQNIAGKHNEDIAKLLFPNDIPQGLKFVDDKEAVFRKLASEKLNAINGLYKLKKWIEDRGLKRAAVTNAPRPNAELMISLLGFQNSLMLGVAAGMPVVGLTTRNPEHLLMEAKPAFLIKDYDDPKLWTALEELDKKEGAEKPTA